MYTLIHLPTISLLVFILQILVFSPLLDNLETRIQSRVKNLKQTIEKHEQKLSELNQNNQKIKKERQQCLDVQMKLHKQIAQMELQTKEMQQQCLKVDEKLKQKCYREMEDQVTNFLILESLLK